MAHGAGWFADPGGKLSTYRWWDGAAWTRWLSADAGAPDPGPAPATADPPFLPRTAEEPEVAPRRAAPEPEAPPAAVQVAPTPGDAVVRLPLAVAVIVGGVLLAIIAVGAIVSLSADRPLSGPAVAPPPPTPPPLSISYDEQTRAAGVEELRVVMPAAPFSCVTLREKGDLFESAVSCGTTVHQDYDREKNDWSASSGLGLVDEGREPGKDLRDTLASAASDLVRRYYTVEDVTIENVRNVPSTVAPQGRARVVTAELHISYPGLSTDFDAMRVELVHLAGGRYVLWWSLVPEDSPAPVVSAAAASAASLSARK